MNEDKKWYESKTMWVSIGTILTGAISAIVSELPLTENVTSITMIIIGTINGALRMVTNSAIKSSQG